MDQNIALLSSQMKQRVLHVFQPRASLDSQNAWNLYGDIAWFGILFGVAQSFLPILIIRLGGTDAHVGLLSALPALAAIFFSLPGSRLVEREKKPLSVLLITVTLNRVGYFAVALIPFLFVTQRADVVIVLIALLTIPGAIANVAFTTMFSHIVRPEHRPRVISTRNLLIGITSTAMALLGGRFLDAVQFPVNYQILFIIAFAASQMSTYYLWRIRMPEQIESDEVPRIKSPHGVGAFVAMLRASHAYSRFTSSAFLLHFGLYFAVPLYPIFWVRSLNASEGWIGLISTVGSATAIAFYPMWGRLMGRRGSHFVLSIVGFALALYPLFTVWSPSIEWILAVQFWGGVFTAGFTVSLFNGLLEVCPDQNRAAHIAAFNTLVNVAAFISPLISTSLTALFGISALLYIGAALRIIAAFLFWRRV